jgi:hypothetical protein
MGLLKKLVSGISILCAFGCSGPDREQERQELIKWIDYHLLQISEYVLSDIEKEKQGFYPHEGKTEYHSKGYIDYILKEKTGRRLEVSERSPLTLEDIKNTNGYRTLERVISEQSYRMELRRVTIDGDEVDSEMSLDEYIDVRMEYFVITVSGWQV